MSSSQHHALGDHPFLDDLDRSTLAVIVDCANIVRFPAGHFVFHRGGLADHFFLIRTGLVAIETHLSADHHASIQTLGDGDVLGWEWLVPPYEWHFDARTENNTTLLSFDAIALRRICQTDRDVGFQIYQSFLPTIAHVVEGQLQTMVDMARNSGQPERQLNG